MIPSLSIGKLTQRVAIQEFADVDDGYGGKTRSWSTVATVWARVQPLVGNERVYGMQLQDEATHKITMRYRTINAKNRILHKGTYYNIVGVPLDEESRERRITIMVKQGVAT